MKTIRYRQVIYRKPQYGSYGEYQVVDGRKVIGRFELLYQAQRVHPDAVPDKSALPPPSKPRRSRP